MSFQTRMALFPLSSTKGTFLKKILGHIIQLYIKCMHFADIQTAYFNQYVSLGIKPMTLVSAVLSSLEASSYFLQWKYNESEWWLGQSNSKTTKKHHKSIIKVIHMTHRLCSKTSETWDCFLYVTVSQILNSYSPNILKVTWNGYSSYLFEMHFNDPIVNISSVHMFNLIVCLHIYIVILYTSHSVWLSPTPFLQTPTNSDLNLPPYQHLMDRTKSLRFFPLRMYVIIQKKSVSVTTSIKSRL